MNHLKSRVDAPALVQIPKKRVQLLHYLGEVVVLSFIEGGVPSLVWIKGGTDIAKP